MSVSKNVTKDNFRIVGNIEFSGDIAPIASGLHDLGNPDQRFRDIYLSDHLNGTSPTIHFGDFDFTATNIIEARDAAALATTALQPGTIDFYTDIWNLPNTLEGYGITETIVTGDFVAESSANLDGSATITTTDRNLIVSGTGEALFYSETTFNSGLTTTSSTITNYLNLSGTLTHDTNIIPSANNTSNIGSSTNRYKQVHVHETVYLGEETFTQTDIGTIRDVQNGAYATAAQGALADSALQPHDDVVVNMLSLSGHLRGPSVTYIDPEGFGDITGKVVILGDLQVDGVTTTVNSTSVAVSGKIINLAQGSADAFAANGSGLNVVGSDATFKYMAGTDSWTTNKKLGVNGPGSTNVTLSVKQSYTGATNHDIFHAVDLLDNTRVKITDQYDLIMSNGSNDLIALKANGRIGVNTTQPTVSLHVNTSDAIMLPRGNDIQRPLTPTQSQRGYIRYNTQSNRFEGFSHGDIWRNLETVSDADRDTYIVAEASDSTDDDTLKFFTDGSVRQSINPVGETNFIVPVPSDEVIKVTNSTPSITFNDDSNSGDMHIQWQSSIGDRNGLRFWRDDATSPDLIISLTGNIGINTTDPTERLHVVDGTIKVEHVAVPKLNLYRNQNDRSTELGHDATGGFWRIDHLSDVLQFRRPDDSYFISANLNTDRFTILGQDGSSRLDLGQWDGYSNRIESSSRELLITSYEDGIYFGENGSKRHYFKNNGEIGVNTLTPDGMLTIGNIGGVNDRKVLTFAEGATPSMWFASGLLPTDGDNYMYLDSPHSIDDGIMTWKLDGSVGIGTTDPQARLDVQNSAAGTDVRFKTTSDRDLNIDLQAGTANNTYRLIVQDEVDVLHIASDTDTIMSMVDSGDIGIGVVNPDFPLHIVHTDADRSRRKLVQIDRAFTPVTAGVTQTRYEKSVEIDSRWCNIPANSTENGYRIALDASCYISDTNFKGYLEQNYGIWARAGAYTNSNNLTNQNPTGTINKSYAVLVDCLQSDNVTINNSYGIYQSANYTDSADDSKNFFASRVGIGSEDPAAKLQVIGPGTIAATDLSKAYILAGTTTAGIGIDPNEIVCKGNSLNIGTAAGNTNDIHLRYNGTNNALTVDGATGRVGINTSSPEEQLTVDGDIRFGATGNYNQFTMKTTAKFGIYEGVLSIRNATIPGTGTSEHATHFATNASATGSTRHDVLIDGRVGIGHVAPGAKLDVRFNQDNSTETDWRNVDGIKVVNESTAAGSLMSLQLVSPGSSIGLVGERVSTDSMNFHIISESLDGDPVSIMKMTNDGLVGIRKSPSYALDVYGAGETAIRVDTSTADNDALVRFAHQGTNHFVIGHEGDTDKFIFHDNITNKHRLTIDSDGRVGINEYNPETMLHIHANTSSVNPTKFITLTNYSPDLAENSSLISFQFVDDNSNDDPQVQIGAIVGANANANGVIPEGAGAFIVKTNNPYTANPDSEGTTATNDATDLQERFRVDYRGYVGIGTKTPSVELDVNGSIKSKDIRVADHAGIITFNDTIVAAGTTTVFKIDGGHGAMAFRINFVMNGADGESVAKTYEVVKQFARQPIQFKVIDTGPFNATTPDIDVSFTQGASNYELVCNVTNTHSTQDVQIVTTMWLAGSPTDLTVTEF